MCMDTPTGDSIKTRPSLLERLKSGEDSTSWLKFYELYGPLIRSFAMKAGLREDEAEEVVQETAVSVAKNLRGFVYDPAVCSFKTWLLNLSAWRVKNQFRRRQRHPSVTEGPPAGDLTGTDDRSSQAPLVERIPDRGLPDFGAEWDEAYDRHLFKLALHGIRGKLDPKAFQIFDLYVLKEQPAGEVARTLGINVARVYLAKYRVEKALRREIQNLERRPGT